MCRPSAIILRVSSLLEATSISKSFDGVHALQRVSFDLSRGEVHALVGENGAGKSTLVRILTGAETPDSGTVVIDRHQVHRFDPTTSKSLGVAAIYQQPSLFPDLTVAENVALALEPPTAWRRIDWPSRIRRTQEILNRIGSSISPSRRASSLSMSEQQVVEIAKAIGAEAKVLIMDEPTASLTDREVGHLLVIVARLREHGAGIIYVSHRLEEVFKIADRITILRDGETLATRSADGLKRDELIHLMVGRELTDVFRKRTVPLGEVALELRRLSSRSAGIRGVSLAIRRGEILGIAGLVGSGRTELAETIFGLRPRDSGEVRVDDVPVDIQSPAEAIRHGIAYLPEDRSRHGVIPDMSVAANASLANLGAVSRAGFVNRQAERREAEQHVRRLRIKTSSVLAPVGSLSGGNQQKVALARWLSIEPRVLILDEPTHGVDIGAKAEIHDIVGTLAERGVAIVMISSELPEILGLSDRIAVMRQGALAGVLERHEATPQKVLALAAISSS